MVELVVWFVYGRWIIINNQQVGRAGGTKWKSMFDAISNPSLALRKSMHLSLAKTERKKKEYEKTLASYNKKLVGYDPRVVLMCLWDEDDD
ncbi:hypothetical protein Ccrd_014924 [Cynara cardunculus var. scolymus]|uniref:Uncharacterized protein n=1 Tax=Cynara cardunculus var. scolymus TaxID=59895 RepID=A0A124SGK9_CYNCS|nr:hypothetical protein Ccrd_014924 [Cynara cardunculus var. scolymus]